MPQEIKQQVFEVRNTSKKKLSFPDLKQVPPLSPEQTIDLFQYVSAADLAKSRSFQRHLMRRRIEAKQKLIGITNSQSSKNLSRNMKFSSIIEQSMSDKMVMTKRVTAMPPPLIDRSRGLYRM